MYTRTVVFIEILLAFHEKVGEIGLGLHHNVYSIPGMAFRAFKKGYIKHMLVANLSSQPSMEKFIRDAYYGGRTEVFTGYIGGNKGYYYDVKGMYAQVMKKELRCGTPY